MFGSVVNTSMLPAMILEKVLRTRECYFFRTSIIFNRNPYQLNVIAKNQTKQNLLFRH